VCSALSRAKYAHKIPFIVKINHNELLTYPNKAIKFSSALCSRPMTMGAISRGRYHLFIGSDQSGRQIVEISQAFAKAHEPAWATVLWCYLPQQRL